MFSFVPSPSAFRIFRSTRHLTVTLFLASGATTAVAAPLAVLSDVKGKVEIQRGAKTQVGKSGTALEAGDSVRVVQGSATVFYASREPQMLKTGGRVQLTGNNSTSAQASVWRTLYNSLSSGYARRSQSSPLVVRVSSGPKSYVPLSVMPSGLIRGQNPTFVWSAPFPKVNAGLKGYLVTVFDAAGKTVWQSTTTDTYLVYPNGAPTITVGNHYSWTVAPRRLQSGANGETVQTDTADTSRALSFSLANATERIASQREVVRLQVELKDAPPTVRRLAIASVLQEMGFKAAALARLNPLRYDPTGTLASTSGEHLQEKPDEPLQVLIESILADKK